MLHHPLKTSVFISFLFLLSSIHSTAFAQTTQADKQTVSAADPAASSMVLDYATSFLATTVAAGIITLFVRAMQQEHAQAFTWYHVPLMASVHYGTGFLPQIHFIPFIPFISFQELGNMLTAILITKWESIDTAFDAGFSAMISTVVIQGGFALYAWMPPAFFTVAALFPLYRWSQGKSINFAPPIAAPTPAP